MKLHPTSWIKQNTLKAKISIRTSQTSTAFLNVFIVWLQVTENVAREPEKEKTNDIVI